MLGCSCVPRHLPTAWNVHLANVTRGLYRAVRTDKLVVQFAIMYQVRSIEDCQRHLRVASWSWNKLSQDLLRFSLIHCCKLRILLEKLSNQIVTAFKKNYRVKVNWTSVLPSAAGHFWDSRPTVAVTLLILRIKSISALVVSLDNLETNMIVVDSFGSTLELWTTHKSWMDLTDRSLRPPRTLVLQRINAARRRTEFTVPHSKATLKTVRPPAYWKAFVVLPLYKCLRRIDTSEAIETD